MQADYVICKFHFRMLCSYYFILFFTDFREKGREGERGRERGRDREKNANLLFHLFVHSLVASCTQPDQGSIRHLDILG